MSAIPLDEITARLKRLPPDKLDVVLDFVSYLTDRLEESEGFQMALASETVLGRDWNSPEEDAAWADL
jgi:hypothetical protein